MLSYLFKRILLFIPTLLIISLVAFGLSRIPTADPVDNCFGVADELSTTASLAYAEKQYLQNAQILGINKPAFYCAFSSQAYPDTLYKIVRRSHRENLEKLIAQYGNWPQIERYFHNVKQAEIAVLNVSKPASRENQLNALREIRQLSINYEDVVIDNRLKKMANFVEQDSVMNVEISTVVQHLSDSYSAIKNKEDKVKLMLPAFHWYGSDNQYHNWFFNFLKGDFGVSCIDKRPAAEKIKEALFWTLLMNICALLLSYLVAVPVGVYAAVYRHSRFDKFSSLIMFIMYSLPVFWVGTLLLMFFATPAYDMQIFPGVGLGDSGAGTPFFTRFWERVAHLTLPVLCLAYPGFARLSRHMRGAMIETLQKDFIRTARAKGLSERRLIWQHAFRNSLFPIITLFASVFPRVLAGSVVLEVIFNIPGMGKLAFDALLSHDWNIVFTVLMLSAVLTMIGILFADVLYAWADPRLRKGLEN